MTTLRITVGEGARLDQQTRAQITAAQDGATPTDEEPVVNFGSIADLGEHLPPANVALLESIASNEPDSVSELARLVDRDPDDVAQALVELETIGVVRLNTAGEQTVPVFPYDGLTIEVPFTRDDTEGMRPRQSRP